MDSNSNIKDRIQLLMNYYGLNINSFTKRIGLDNNTIIGKIINIPDRKPSYDNIAKILRAFPKVSCRWFLLGEASMFGGLDDFLPEANERVLHINGDFFV